MALGPYMGIIITSTARGDEWHTSSWAFDGRSQPTALICSTCEGILLDLPETLVAASWP